ncbi:MAG: hypothetical protein US30_C0016G0006 [Candidatus Moranbacteria bacterium GW2011_GWF2_36_839]|nr:MAG: hypothetical protein US27_C0017G0006 [Candidatus Moranbacteria bacterium GW2011_GWF1_36_78]KKQ16482.1 MAG: hypothetical protein US30_C0016G0006 [Candidatus Moranbacteria bacterium GW2011_GWF2_36_839]HAT74088.1 hypothetical protein [Candidatus Moranbacteria bacterium]HBY10703.1 hypothetical protein [Candidatus Moranbacteria bacterium]
MKKVKVQKRPARHATRQNNISKEPSLDEEFLSQYDDDWHSVAGGEKEKKPKMRVSGKSVFKIKEIKDRK